MRKKILVATLLVGLLAACGGSATSVVGTWVEPVPGMAGPKKRIKKRKGGGGAFFFIAYVNF